MTTKRLPLIPCPRSNCGGSIVRFGDGEPRCVLCARAPSREQLRAAGVQWQPDRYEGSRETEELMQQSGYSVRGGQR